MNHNIINKIDFTNLGKFFESVNDKNINLQSLDKVTQNKILLEGIVNAINKSDNSIVEYLVNVEKYDSKSLHYLNDKLKLKIKVGL